MSCQNCGCNGNNGVPCGPPKSTELGTLVWFGGLDVNGCHKYMSLGNLTSPCAIGGQIPTGVIANFTGVDANGCLVKQTGAVGAFETDWNATSPVGTIIIGNSGATAQNGHTPTLDVVRAPTQGTIPNVLQTIAGQGVFVPINAGIVPQDSSTIDFSLGGVTGVLSANVKLSPAAGNLATIASDGVYVSPNLAVAVNAPLTGTGVSPTPLDLDFSLMSALDRCALGQNLPLSTIVDVAGRDVNGCLVYEQLVNLIPRAETDFAPSVSGGLTYTVGGVNGHAPTFGISLCNLGAAILAGTLTSVVGKNASGCLAFEDDVSFVQRLETAFSAVAGAGITVAPGGTHGHSPTFSVNLCTLGQAMPVATSISQFVGVDANGCLVRASSANVNPPETVLSLVAGFGVLITPGGTNGHTPTIAVVCEDIQDCISPMFTPWGSYNDTTNKVSLVPSTTAGNVLTISVDGRPYVPTPVQTSVSANDTNSISWILSGANNHNLTANVELAGQQGCAANSLQIVSGQGLFVPQVDTFSAQVQDVTVHTLSAASTGTYLSTGIAPLTITLCRPARVNIITALNWNMTPQVSFGEIAVFTQHRIDGTAMLPSGSMTVAGTSIEHDTILLAAGTHTISIEYRVVAGSGLVVPSIFRAKMTATWIEVN